MKTTNLVPHVNTLFAIILVTDSQVHNITLPIALEALPSSAKEDLSLLSGLNVFDSGLGVLDVFDVGLGVTEASDVGLGVSEACDDGLGVLGGFDNWDVGLGVFWRGVWDVLDFGRGVFLWCDEGLGVRSSDWLCLTDGLESTGSDGNVVSLNQESTLLIDLQWINS